mmetsp:Transcript_33497/g.68498  ORF Transcript_33497/g.68498 Transcript_33497/m.68498 type:complete len:438 (+) Transcript_33497:3-1316(+)
MVRRWILRAISLFALRVDAQYSSNLSRAQSDDATSMSKRRAQVYKYHPHISDYVRAHLSDYQISSLLELLHGIDDVVIAGGAGLHLTSEALPAETSTVPAKLVPLPCSYHGTMRAVAPWSPAGSNPYNTLWDVHVPLDLRETPDWASIQLQLEDQVSEICSSVAPNQVLNKEGMTMESCAVDFMQQFDMFVGAMCNRANEGIGIDLLEATLSTSYTEMMPNSSSCINPTPFDAICRLAGTDKSSYLHGFAAFYDQQIARMRAAPTAILEVGVLQGRSLGAWASKFPCATVLGLDAFVLKEDPAMPVLQPGRYTVQEADQEDPASLLAATAGQSFDLIIDDGGHSMRQQQNTMQALWPKVRSCGIFIMEDLHTSIARWVPQYHDFSPTTLDIITGVAPSGASKLVDFGKILSEAVSVELFWPSDNDITAVIQKKCKVS